GGLLLPWPAVVKRVLLASPRGYCAGVERAVETVEKALELYGRPVYVRKQIVHNAHVVRELEARGAIFVDDERDAPEGATLVLSAHGVEPAVFERAAARRQSTRAAARRHLRRDVEPSVGGEGAARRGRPPARDRLAQFVEFQAAGRGRGSRGSRSASRRRRNGDRRVVARRSRDGRRDIRGVSS